MKDLGTEVFLKMYELPIHPKNLWLDQDPLPHENVISKLNFLGLKLILRVICGKMMADMLAFNRFCPSSRTALRSSRGFSRPMILGLRFCITCLKNGKNRRLSLTTKVTSRYDWIRQGRTNVSKILMWLLTNTQGDPSFLIISRFFISKRPPTASSAFTVF